MRGGIVCAALLLSLAGGLSEGIDLGADFAHSADDNVDIEPNPGCSASSEAEACCD